jgi:heme-degrading monooxygenase HmoA
MVTTMPTTQPVTLINAFEVPPDTDEAFVAGWERARGFLAARDAFRATALHRALRPDVDFRYVGVAEVDSPQRWKEASSDPAFPAASMPFPAHPGLYEVVREDATPDVDGGVVLINPFEVPDGEGDRFLAGWDRARDALAEQRGYLGTRLHRSLGPADFQFVNVARWSSPLMFARALARPEFQRAAEAMPFPAHPALYQVIGA